MRNPGALEKGQRKYPQVIIRYSNGSDQPKTNVSGFPIFLVLYL